MIDGAHVVVYSKDAEADRACSDVDELVAVLGAKGVAFAPIEEVGWGRLTRITLPGGGEVGVYQPKHERAPAG